mmetsp:Transcript_19191/g.48496  ORF Transcript_19191/g.48496 Transcript_19191/m.48496 type:complete len:233 (-) Transcript_19191:1019-1717(-)
MEHPAGKLPLRQLRGQCQELRLGLVGELLLGRLVRARRDARQGRALDLAELRVGLLLCLEHLGEDVCVVAVCEGPALGRGLGVRHPDGEPAVCRRQRPQLRAGPAELVHVREAGGRGVGHEDPPRLEHVSHHRLQFGPLVDNLRPVGLGQLQQVAPQLRVAWGRGDVWGGPFCARELCSKPLLLGGARQGGGKGLGGAVGVRGGLGDGALEDTEGPGGGAVREEELGVGVAK